MSQYSEIVGSFKRLGSYPIEADYIFPTVEDLKNFYNDPINATTLHKGLLKVVENGGDGKQALYWVVRNEISNQLEFVKLLQDTSIDTIDTDLAQLIQTVNNEITERKNWDQIIIGTPDYESIPSEYNSIYDLSSAIENVDNLHIKNETDLKAVVGTDQDDIVSYLKTLPYQNLTEMALKLDQWQQGVSLESDNTGNVKLDICETDTGFLIKGQVKISDNFGNRIINKNDGIYLDVRSDYSDGVLTLRVNDTIVSQHFLGITGLLKSAQYDEGSASIILVFKLDNADTETITIPVGNLVRGWDISNDNADRVVELYKEVDPEDGSDLLSADVRIAEVDNNILEKSGNTLLVKGESTNIKHNDQTVSEILTQLLSHVSNEDNPHNVTPAQLNVYSKTEEDALLQNKADLVGGKVPENQLPEIQVKWQIIE